MSVEILFAGVPVVDLGAALDWYGRLLDREPDIVVKHDEVMWKIAAGAWLYVLEDAQHAGNALVTLAVRDLDRAVADLEDRGLRAAPIEAIGDAGRKATLTDLEGNTIAFIQVA